MQQFFFSDVTQALDLDGLNESHPILQEVASPDEINSLFDSISYSKVTQGAWEGRERGMGREGERCGRGGREMWEWRERDTGGEGERLWEESGRGARCGVDVGECNSGARKRERNMEKL